MLQIVLFDVDGVLVNGESFSKLLARDYGITREMTASFFQGRFTECLIGKADLKQVLTTHLDQWGWQGSVDDFLHCWFDSEHCIDELLVREVQLLRQQGICCYLATNQEKYRTAYILEQMGFAERFDGIFSSAHIGYAKHDARFFAHVLYELADVPADHILFWDDSPGNVTIAKTVGIQAELYRDFVDFKQKMARYLAIL